MASYCVLIEAVASRVSKEMLSPDAILSIWPRMDFKMRAKSSPRVFDEKIRRSQNGASPCSKIGNTATEKFPHLLTSLNHSYILRGRSSFEDLLAIQV